MAVSVRVNCIASLHENYRAIANSKTLKIIYTSIVLIKMLEIKELSNLKSSFISIVLLKWKESANFTRRDYGS